MLSGQLIEFNTFIGAQYKVYKKLLTKFEKSIGGDETQVEGMVHPFHLTANSLSKHKFRLQVLGSF